MGDLVHVLCGTCVGEYDRRCGYFESKSAREAILDMDRTVAGKSDRMEYCCRCGQDSYVAATFRQGPGKDWPCDGVHEPFEED